MARLRRSPLTVFSLISFVVMAAIAGVLGVVLERRIDDRALASAASTAEVLGEIAVRRYVPTHELQTGLSARTIRQLDDHLRAEKLRGVGVEKVKVFDARRALVYTNDGSPVGKVSPPTGNVATALRGERVESLARGTADTDEGDLTLSVYAPLRYAGRDRPSGVFEVYLDYGPTAAAARRDVLTMWALVGGGLVVLWLLLFRLVRGASSALRRQVAENRRQATHDALTDLPNRSLLFEHVGAAVAHGRAALLMIDLDGFREINDTLGHDHGDELLVDVARRLRDAAHPDDIVARLGGDEYAVLRDGLDGEEEEARELAEALGETLREPLTAGGTTVVLDASIGVALAPEHGRDVTTIARRAEVAMYVAKRKRSRVEVYDADRDHHNRDRLQLLGELGGAIRRGELVLAYQPIVALDSGAVAGVEALVRWQHPSHGLVMPGQFVPGAELTSLVRPLTLHVLDSALRTHRTWADAGLHLPVAVNLAGPCVMDAGIPPAVADLLADHGVAPGALTLEISEGTMMSDVPSALRVLAALRQLGVRLSLDDFGTGQTSIGQLRQLPLDEMKVDRSLVVGDGRLLSSVVEIAHRFDLQAVGEGVETPEIASALAAAGCELAQGFLFARPMWAEDVPGWMSAHELARTADAA